MQEYLQRTEKILSRLNQLAAITEEPGQISRTFGSEAFMKGSQLVKEWMEAAGLQTRTDNIGNVRGRLEPAPHSKRTFVIGSHIDTVQNAGKFDGPLGVLLGLDLLENLSTIKPELPFNLELIAFSDEEGVRFHTTYLGSKVVAGSFEETALTKKDAAGITLNEAIKTLGGDPEKLKHDAIPSEVWVGYFEVHIEQGPVLYELNIPVAIVTSISGQNRIEITLKGMAGHAGTVPMPMRRDALCGASDFILKTEEYARKHKESLVATVGKLAIPNQASNVIPGVVNFTLDIRSANETTLKIAEKDLRTLAEELCRIRNLELSWELVQQTEPVTCNPKLNDLLSEAITEAGYAETKLVSGAGHDAVPISKVAPVSMLFVRCYEGISHNPLENAEPKDIAAALRVSENFLHKLLQEQLQQQHIGVP
ncbi:allantoate amidohydrolase [Adhaeribacter soli]|uniref:Allantoate amidohydrolase n=1 Tax=Adhaeribacter soli TaxID=2607655 RepID=A0A5N1J970_9BACT|nr:allantoate amidohydrolase [Adhaeribacter soli]KAA9345528.1 allantoate amidohydrolase [Adhaeribacter soli]